MAAANIAESEVLSTEIRSLGEVKLRIKADVPENQQNYPALVERSGVVSYSCTSSCPKSQSESACEEACKATAVKLRSLSGHIQTALPRWIDFSKISGSSNWIKDSK